MPGKIVLTINETMLDNDVDIP